MNEHLSIEQLRDILVTEHGIIFYPKRSLDIPEIKSDSVANLVKGGKLTPALRNISVIQRYLGGEPVGDSWGTDHNSRVEWRADLYRQFGDYFLELYFNHNQFRTSRIYLTRLSIMTLGEMMQNESLAVELMRIGNKVGEAVRGDLFGVDYDYMGSLDNKLQVVQFVEDRSIEALNVFTS